MFDVFTTPLATGVTVSMSGGQCSPDPGSRHNRRRAEWTLREFLEAEQFTSTCTGVRDHCADGVDSLTASSRNEIAEQLRRPMNGNVPNGPLTVSFRPKK